MRMNHCLLKVDVSFLKSHERKQAYAEIGGNGWWHHTQINHITHYTPPCNNHQSLRWGCNSTSPEAT